MAQMHRLQKLHSITGSSGVCRQTPDSQYQWLMGDPVDVGDGGRHTSTVVPSCLPGKQRRQKDTRPALTSVEEAPQPYGTCSADRVN
jgi:hypothetical protein